MLLFRALPFAFEIISSIRLPLNDDDEESMRVAMIRTGYVGLVSGACLDDWRRSLLCSAVKSHFEPDLERIVAIKRAKAGSISPPILVSLWPRPCSLQSARLRGAATVTSTRPVRAVAREIAVVLALHGGSNQIDRNAFLATKITLIN
jgi:hypothetical protein